MSIKVGLNIKNIRKSKNMLQVDLAKALGVTNATISSWEVGRTEPDMEMVEKLSHILECNITDITGGSSNSFYLSNMEKALIIAYRQADEIDQRIVLRTLGIESKKSSSESLNNSACS